MLAYFVVLPFSHFFFLSAFLFSIEMTTKFNQDMYAKMRVKKNEPFSAFGKRVVRVMDQGSPTVPVTTVTGPTRVASPATLVEEITPRTKKARMANKGKEKASSRLFSVWDDADLA